MVSVVRATLIALGGMVAVLTVTVEATSGYSMHHLPPLTLDARTDASGIVVSDFQLLSRESGIVFDVAQLHRTDDDGITWKDITPPIGPTTRQQIIAARFLDTSVGWVFRVTPGQDERGIEVWRTYDGGASWLLSEAPLPANAGTLSATFLDRNLGWALLRLPSNSNFSYGRLFATTDGGRSWSELPRPPSAGRLVFESSVNGWLLGGPEQKDLFVTHDGGLHWAVQHIPVDTDGAVSIDVALPRVAGHGLLSSRVAVWSHGGRGAIHDIEICARDGSARKLSTLFVEAERGDGGARLVASTEDIAILSGEVAVRRASTHTPSPEEGTQRVLIDSSGALSRVESLGSRIWLLSHRSGCRSYKSECFHEAALATYRVGVSEIRDITPNAGTTAARIDRAFPGQRDPAANAVLQSNKPGFDKCTVGSVSNMQTWKSSSPYFDANIYIGGSNRSCSQSLLTSSWVSQVLAQNWRLIPTWVGPQSPSTQCGTCSVFSTNSSTARQQGIDQANLAATAMSSLGLNAPSIIYYDLEIYNTQTSAETQFVDGWVERLHQLGHKAGLYVHWTNVAAFTNLSNPLDGVWIARWYYGAGGSPPPPSTIPSPDSIPGVSNSIFAGARIWQYYGNVSQTWGGVAFTIDIDTSNGLVAVGGGASNAPDLVPISLSAPSTATPGGQITVSATVKNEGTANSGTYRLGFYYSTNSTITASDTYSGSACNMATLSAGGSQACSGPVLVPSTLAPGTYYFGAYADDLGAVTESDEGNNTTTTVVTVAASTYTISVSASPSQGGTVTGAGTFNAGTSRTVTAMANNGYTFANWTEGGSAVSSSSSYNFTLNSNRNLVANFTPVNYSITLSVSPAGAGTTSGGGSYPAGSSRTVTATPNSGFSFSRWTESGNTVSQSASYEFTVTASRNLVAVFTDMSNPAPSISTLSPGTITAGSPDFTLTVDGTGFVPASVVYWNASARQTSYVSGNRLTALIAAADIASQGSAAVTVSTPPPGGGTSDAISITIQPSAGGECTPATIASCPFSTTRALSSTSCTGGTRGGNYYTDVFSFVGAQGANVTIDLSASFDTYVYLLAPDGTIAASNDDSNGTTNSQIVSTLTVGGTWKIEATTYSEAETGSYTLSITGCGGPPLVAPTGLVVTYKQLQSGPGVGLVWNGVANVVNYEAELNGMIVDLHSASAVATLSGLAEPVCYSVRVRAVGASGQRSGWSNRDIATSVVFTNDPIVEGVTAAKTSHLNELRSAVATVRSAAGLAPFSFSEAIVRGTVVRAAHVVELRKALNDALSSLGVTTVALSDPQPKASLIRAADIQQLRNAMK